MLIINNLRTLSGTSGRGLLGGLVKGVPKGVSTPHIRHRIDYLLPVCDPSSAPSLWLHRLWRTTHRIGGIKPFQDLWSNRQNLLVIGLDKHKAVFLSKIQAIHREAVFLSLVAILNVAREPVVRDLENAVL